MAKATEKTEKKTTAKAEAKAPSKPRATQKVTMSQTKVIEGQFSTRLQSLASLDLNLVAIDEKFEDKEAFVPTQVTAARLKIADAMFTLTEAKDEFAKIGEQYRSFFG